MRTEKARLQRSVNTASKNCMLLQAKVNGMRKGGADEARIAAVESKLNAMLDKRKLLLESLGKLN